MTREQEIFLELVELSSAEARAAFLARATVDEPKLREAVEELLAHHKADAFLEKGAGELLRESLNAAGRLTQ